MFLLYFVNFLFVLFLLVRALPRYIWFFLDFTFLKCFLFFSAMIAISRKFQTCFSSCLKKKYLVNCHMLGDWCSVCAECRVCRFKPLVKCRQRECFVVGRVWWCFGLTWWDLWLAECEP